MEDTGAEPGESRQKPASAQRPNRKTLDLPGLLKTLVPPPPVIPPDISPRILKAVDFLSSRLTEDVHVEEAAREAGFSRFHFIRRFQAEVGRTPHRYLVLLRVHMAKQLLVTRPDLLIHEVGRLVGYTDPTAFARVFKAREGASPHQYRHARLRCLLEPGVEAQALLPPAESSSISGEGPGRELTPA